MGVRSQVLLFTRKTHCRGRGARQSPLETRHRLPFLAMSCDKLYAVYWRVVLREAPLGLSTRDFRGSGSQEPLPGAPQYSILQDSRLPFSTDHIFAQMAEVPLR